MLTKISEITTMRYALLKKIDIETQVTGSQYVNSLELVPQAKRMVMTEPTCLYTTSCRPVWRWTRAV